MKWSWILPVVLVLSCLPARATDFGDLSVRVELLSPGSNQRGYQEYRATISNRSPAKTHRVTLVFPHELYRMRSNAIREMTRTVEVAPNATAVVSLFQPPLSLAGAGVRVLIDGREQETAIPLTFSSGGSGGMPYGEQTELVLASAEVGKSKVLDYAESALRKPDGRLFFNTARSELPVTEWSTHWLGYSRYSGVVLTAADWRAMPDAVRGALWRYLECGGTLLIFGGVVVPAHWHATLTEISPSAQAATAVEVRPTPEPGENDEADATPTPTPLPTINVREYLQSYAVGLGQLFVMPAQPQPALSPAQWQKVEESWRNHFFSGRPYDSHNASFERLNSQLPIIERLTTPVRGLFLLMLLFVIVIGPVNLLVLARWRKKLWLLWTVPAISLVTCLAIAAYAIASEGVASYTRTLCLTVLDEHEHRASSIGVIGFYAPLTPSDGLHFSYDTALTPLLPYTYYYSEYGDRGGTLRTLDWSNEQHLSSGWVSARVPTWFQVRKSETRRERLTVSKNARGAFVVTNGLGVPIRQLWLPDEQRALYTVSNIAPGAQVELLESKRSSATYPKRLTELITGDWQEQFANLENNPEEWLAPGTYLAVLDTVPFIEPGLRNVRQAQAKTLIYGIRGK